MVSGCDVIVDDAIYFAEGVFQDGIVTQAVEAVVGLRHTVTGDTLGDRLAGLAADNGWSGVIVNGCIRDSAEIADIDVGVLALATNPLKSKKNGDGQSATSVSFAGITIRPDDYLYVDEDGWLVAHERLHTGS